MVIGHLRVVGDRSSPLSGDDYDKTYPTTNIGALAALRAFFFSSGFRIGYSNCAV